MTKEQAREAAQVMLGFADGKEVQCAVRKRQPCTWEPAVTSQELGFDWSVYTYRLKPTPVLRPWTADEVPIGAITRIKHSVNPSNPSRQIIDGENGVMAFLCGCPWSFPSLLENREHSTDGGKTWLPCGVEEVGK